MIVGALYDFVRSCLETPERKFVLCLPPRTKLTEPSITLFKAGLSPASNVLFGWIEKANEGKEEEERKSTRKKRLIFSKMQTPCLEKSIWI